ncbi:hypothetical protein [Stieleria mannarensis]|uniref:hypothetical protein n=1 Tax=Stieleria mannarensis TaxID=2755585 RepID=UPI001C7223F5|nr:hypothetical protein [Rhodopirellula sp. JC639]
MSDFSKQPILNSPYEHAGKYQELDDTGLPTQSVKESRRIVCFTMPIAKPKKLRGKKNASAEKQREMVFADTEGLQTEKHQYDPNPVVNDFCRFEKWRQAEVANWNVAPAAAPLLQHRRGDHFSSIRPFFCRIKFPIWLTEGAPSLMNTVVDRFTVAPLPPKRPLSVGEDDELIDPLEQGLVRDRSDTSQVADYATEFNKRGRIQVLKPRMNAEMHMSADLKNTGKGNLFVIFGEPDITVRESKAKGAKLGDIEVQINGVDVFQPSTGEVRSDGADGIACWFIDTDYNEESFFVRHAYFLGANAPYKSLKTTLKAEIDKEAWDSLNSDVSRPFPQPKSGRIAVKVINHLGDEVMKVSRVRELVE